MNDLLAIAPAVAPPRSQSRAQRTGERAAIGLRFYCQSVLPLRGTFRSPAEPFRPIHSLRWPTGGEGDSLFVSYLSRLTHQGMLRF